VQSTLTINELLRQLYSMLCAPPNWPHDKPWNPIKFKDFITPDNLAKIVVWHNVIRAYFYETDVKRKFTISKQINISLSCPENGIYIWSGFKEPAHDYKYSIDNAVWQFNSEVFIGENECVPDSQGLIVEEIEGFLRYILLALT